MAHQKFKRQAWKDQIDMLGPFSDLAQLQKILDAVPAEERDQDFYFHQGIFYGRVIYEELGGVDKIRVTRLSGQKKSAHEPNVHQI